MSVGLPAGLGKALKAQAPMPAEFKDKDDSSSDKEEAMDAVVESAQGAQQE